MHSFLSAEELERLLGEDVPYFDLTTFALGIGEQPGMLTFTTRQPTVICGTEEVCRILEQCGAAVKECLATGQRLLRDTTFLMATGPAQALHRAWKVSVNLLEYASGIATRTRELVTVAHSINPAVAVVTTRKIFPGTKALSVKAVLAGGALPHRLGLSETVLVFPQHLVFLGGLDGLRTRLAQLQHPCAEKKICVEVANLDDAFTVAQMGVDSIQFDKLPAAELVQAIAELKHLYPSIKLAAAGGINIGNVREYVATGVDMVVTTTPYFGQPADIAAKMAAIA